MTTNGSSNDDHRTLSGVPVAPLYSPEQLAGDGFNPAADLGNPGEFPFTRGAYPTMYRGAVVDAAADCRVRDGAGDQ